MEKNNSRKQLYTGFLIIILFYLPDSAVTPIQPHDTVGHGQVLDSDSLSDFQGQSDHKQGKGRRKQKRYDHGREKSSNGLKGTRSNSRTQGECNKAQ